MAMTLKIEFEFYCVMVARLAYEYFLKVLGGEHYRHQDGNKTTLQGMRCLLFEKRNFTLEQDSNSNFVLTLLDTNGNDLERNVSEILDEWSRGKTKYYGGVTGVLFYVSMINTNQLKCPVKALKKCPV